jgi:glycosyltransferase involved in cell wall biosynthesis
LRRHRYCERPALGAKPCRLAVNGTETIRRRVLFALPSLRGGGAERVLVTLLAHLDRQRFEPHLLLVEAVGPYLSDVPADVPVHALAAPRLRRAALKLAGEIRRLRPAVIVSTQGYMNFALLLMRPLFAPTRLVVREVIGERYLENSRFQPLFYRWYLRQVRRADRIVVQSDAARDEMQARVRARAGQIVRVYNPVDVARVSAIARAGANPLPGPGPHLVAAGRLGHQKGFDMLLDAVAGVLARGVPATLTILGEGPDRAALEARAAELGIAAAVRFAGFQANPFAYFAHADLFVLSSRYEGLPNVVLEALACGCPVVAFDCPRGVREIVRDGVNGVLLPAGDVRGLRDALTRLLQFPAERERLRQHVPSSLAPFTAPTVVREWEALLDDVTFRAAV